MNVKYLPVNASAMVRKVRQKHCMPVPVNAERRVVFGGGEKTCSCTALHPVPLSALDGFSLVISFCRVWFMSEASMMDMKRWMLKEAMMEAQFVSSFSSVVSQRGAQLMLLRTK